jgi:tRNA uridine 5-carbamoylmethylation protein Kti12
MNNELMIIVAGTTCSGKSTMILQLEKLLKENGFNVEFSFKNHPDYGGENTYHFRNKVNLNFDKEIEIIKSSTKIILKEMQLTCELKPNNEDKRDFYTNA